MTKRTGRHAGPALAVGFLTGAAFAAALYATSAHADSKEMAISVNAAVGRYALSCGTSPNYSMCWIMDTTNGKIRRVSNKDYLEE